MLPFTKALAGLDPGFARRLPTANSRYPEITLPRKVKFQCKQLEFCFH